MLLAMAYLLHMAPTLSGGVKDLREASVKLGGAASMWNAHPEHMCQPLMLFWAAVESFGHRA